MNHLQLLMLPWNVKALNPLSWNVLSHSTQYAVLTLKTPYIGTGKWYMDHILPQMLQKW